MDAETIHLLEFDRVLSILAGYSQTESGRASILNIKPDKYLEIIQRQLAEIAEMQEHISLNGPLSCSHLQPASAFLKDLEDSAQPLPPEDLFSILEHLQLASRIQKIFVSDAFPLLSGTCRR